MTRQRLDRIAMRQLTAIVWRRALPVTRALAPVIVFLAAGMAFGVCAAAAQDAAPAPDPSPGSGTGPDAAPRASSSRSSAPAPAPAPAPTPHTSAAPARPAAPRSGSYTASPASHE